MGSLQLNKIQKKDNLRSSKGSNYSNYRYNIKDSKASNDLNLNSERSAMSNRSNNSFKKSIINSNKAFINNGNPITPISCKHINYINPNNINLVNSVSFALYPEFRF